ncbi:unnamed protein product [Ambrosiozyma monospora]|uniref:Unnamed protein product n=1 Tax=Ambrosiozyma monospora TaxID=43982 RepID=A0ACB5SUY7_AMBMO|nr:unnamed protein product [Ambrosiozyma monospora]
MITKQPELFDEYHKGFRSQVESWPENPVDGFVRTIFERGCQKNVNAPGGLPGLVSEPSNGGRPKKTVVIADIRLVRLNWHGMLKNI